MKRRGSFEIFMDVFYLPLVISGLVFVLSFFLIATIGIIELLILPGVLFVALVIRFHIISKRQHREWVKDMRDWLIKTGYKFPKERENEKDIKKKT